jgi:hypothetical protein
MLRSMAYAAWRQGKATQHKQSVAAGVSESRGMSRAEWCRYLLVGIFIGFIPASGHAQNRGVYPLGLSAINSGVSAEPGLTYNNSFLFYSRDEQKGANGEVLATGQQSVLLDMNTFLWVSDDEIARLGGARFSSAVTVPIANNSLSSTAQGAISGGGGLGDLYFQPIILGWRTPRLDLRGILGVLAPTGKFTAGATNNVGNGYWTPVVAAGETIYLTADRATTLSIFEMYEFHTTQSGTQIHPGETLDIDYSLMHAFAYAESRLQVGLVGYGAWQTTAKTGPSISAAEQGQRYRVNALGVGANFVLPARKVTLSFKYFDEFANQWTYQGYALQISAAVGF